MLNARWFKALYRIRRVEQEIARVYPTDKVKSPVHLSIGQEAVSVGLCEALAPRDIVFGTYRSHALYLAKGGDLNAMIAELYGKQTGCCKGKGGSMHLADLAHGVMGTSAVVGTTIPNAAGYAYAQKLRRTPTVTAVVCGDGATEEGVFWETINFASLHKLPLLIVCENNSYAIHSPLSHRQVAENLVERVAAFKLQSERVPDNDMRAIVSCCQSAVEKIRAGRGPVFLECRTYRWMEHVGPNEDFKFGYRSRDEAEPWVKNDSLKKVGELLDANARQKIEQEIEGEIAAAFAFAEKSPWPEAGELHQHVFKEEQR